MAFRYSYYNEIDPYAAQWLRDLIAAGHISDGVVDERSIEDVRPADLKGFTRCHFFAGLGGWDYALALAGYPADQEVWTGSCPCQPFSAAGKGTGFADERHLWPAWFHLIRERKPAVVLGEQVAAATDWLALVLGDLEAVGYAVGAMPIPAACVGALHRRKRFWFAADAQRDESSEPRCRAPGRVGREQQPFPWDGGWEAALARFRVVDHGIPRRVAATDAARNAIVPQVAAAFIRATMSATGLHSAD